MLAEEGKTYSSFRGLLRGCTSRAQHQQGKGGVTSHVAVCREQVRGCGRRRLSL